MPTALNKQWNLKLEPALQRAVLLMYDMQDDGKCFGEFMWASVGDFWSGRFTAGLVGLTGTSRITLGESGSSMQTAQRTSLVHPYTNVTTTPRRGDHNIGRPRPGRALFCATRWMRRRLAGLNLRPTTPMVEVVRRVSS